MLCGTNPIYLLRFFIICHMLCFSQGYMRDYYNSLFRPMSLNKAKVETLGNILKGHVQKLRDTRNRKVELVFLVDSSASVGASNFFDELKFVRKLLADFTVDVNATRVSVITFSSRGKVIRHVDHLTLPKASNQKCGLLGEEMPKIRYIGGGTYTLGAFIEAKNVLKSARKEAAKAIFLITDGFSNGGDPRPEASVLREMGVTIFTFGIRNGNVRELFDMASEPRNETCYILDSFEEFEALARRALHEDLHSGSYILQSKSSCDSLCKERRDCCHVNADCMCGTHTGKYECLCQPGYYGHGFGKTGCALCPSKTFKNYTGAGDIKSCIPCPDDNHVTGVGSTDISECTCRKGYHNTTDIHCAAYRCSMLESPANGYFVNNKCNNVFNAACGLRCRPGYELRGSSLRICQEDSTWSGTTTGCIMKTCSPLSTPKHGHMICSRDDFTYSTECRFTCDNGFKLVGSRKRSCLAIALWTGITTRCREITCQPLVPLRDGIVTPPGCTKREVLFGTTCQMTCLSAYTLYGPSSKQCTPDGNWAPPGNKPNQCIDDNPPFIQCPRKFVVVADTEEPETMVDWQVPLAVDNSGLIPTTIAIPALVPPAKLPIGYTTITYIAEDWNKNKAKCKVYIHVVDKTPPRVDRCFPPKAVISPDKYGNVTWQEPIFSDNSGEDLQIVKTHTPGWFSLGKTNVTYTAIDKSGNNNTCVLEINVIPHPCEYPNPPVNGNITCFQNSEGVICSIFCMADYAFAIPPAEEYFCAYDDVWKPEDQMPFPDCSVKHISNDIVQEASFTFTGILSCRDRQILNQIKSKFEKKVTNRINEICVGEIHCSIDDLETTCEENEDFNKVKFTLERRRKRSTPKRDSKPKFNSGKTFLTFDFSLEGSVISTGDFSEDRKSQKKLEKTLKKVLRILQNDAKEGEFDLLTLGKKIFFNGIELEDTALKFKCEDGQVLLGSDCVNCPVGTFFNVVHRKCESCLTGTYQEIEGEITCFFCPNKTSTKYNQTRSERECLAQCLPGSFSETGLERCETCPIGWYQSEYSQTNCTACSPGLTTARRGCRTRQECKEICPRGYVSKNGLEPCFACPRGTFQPDGQKSACFECPNNASTFDIASISLKNCEGDWDLQSDGVISEIQNQQQQLAINECFENPCTNGGTCIPKIVAFSCDCLPGFGGIFCESVLDECKAKPCLNNGTCVSLTGDYSCNCIDGFKGKKCEMDIDECESFPCSHGGTCIDGINEFICICPPGYQGVNCDSDINDCSESPCRNGGSCKDKLVGYVCVCPGGYSGITCEIEEDECLSNPCRNNATCVDVPGNFRCTCLAGYTGKKCGRDINDCKPNPCKNGATCEDLVHGFLCHCLTWFRGTDCSTPLDVNYQLDFVAPGIVDRAEIQFPDGPFTSLTVTFWMKSDDILNFGTPYSYAVPGTDNAFTLTDYNGFVVMVNQEKRVTDLVANDGIWHHIVVTWSSNRGVWKIYQDGLIIDSGWDLSTGKPVPGGGMFVIGQEQDAVGGMFSSSESFVGSVTHLNVWNDELPLDTIEEMRITCNKFPGNLLAWSEVYSGLRGTLTDSPSTFCEECPIPSKPDFGDVKYTGLSTGSTSTFSCLRGYNVAGQNDQLCLATGDWEGEQPACAKVDCGFPGNIKNGYNEGRRYSFDNRVQYHCYKGYELIGSKRRYCNEYGEWEGEKPKCIETTCTLPLLSVNTVVTNMKSKYVPSYTVQFSCTPGHRMLTPHSYVKCQFDGTWDKSVPTCDPQICTSAPEIDFGGPVNELDEYSVGGQVEYECDFGYKLSIATTNKKGKISCLPSGDWELDLPLCEIVSCQEIPLVAHANISGDTVTFLSSVQYQCHLGYNMIGDDIIECYETGEWTPEPPECRPVSCGKPNNIDNGLLQGVSYDLNSVIIYKCDAGYRLNAETRSRCLNTGSWSGIERICNPVECAQPDSINNGEIVISEVTFQSTITYTCNEGYELDGSEYRSCLETGEWSASKPMCLPVICGTPPDIVNGNFHGLPPYVFEVTVVYSCTDGYEMIGNTNISCKSNTEWSDHSPMCVQITCEEPGVPSNGFVNALGVAYASKAEYECSEGYILEGVSSRTCQIDKTWSETTPMCKPTQCHPPDTVQNGEIQFKDLNIGSIVRYACDIAHVMVGDEIRRCQDNLTWSGQPVQCNAVECPNSLFVTNGRVIVSGTNFGSISSYICDEGYIIEGDNERVCTEVGQWSNGIPVCEIIECDRTASVISNGKMGGENFTFGSIINYDCDDGYSMLGSATRFCESNGMWDEPLPVCQIVQCPSYFLANGFVDGFKRDFNSKVTYSCKKGFRLEGPKSRTCLAGGIWEGDDPICLKIICPTISHIDFGSFVTISSLSIRYECNVGYDLKGPYERTCQENGTWSSDDPFCEIISCTDLTTFTLIGGSIYQNTFTYQSTVNFVCDAGFRLDGGTGAVCQANGTWSDEIPTCNILSCGQPGDVLNGIINGTVYTYGSLLTYTCLEGTRLVGVSERRCGEDGQWVEPSPRCEQIVCPDLDNITFGSYSIHSNTYQGLVKYTCIPGYELLGEETRECLVNGDWSDQNPVCAPVHCNHPHILENGHITGTEYHFQKEIIYECSEGYHLVGDSVRTCNADRRWSGNEVRCELIRCEDPIRFEHGRILGEYYNYSDSITYVCNEGYNLIGDKTRVCTKNRIWNVPEPHCEIVSCQDLPNIPFASIRGNQKLFNTSNTAECDVGYKPFGDPDINCLANGNWSISDFRCEIISCPHIATIQQGGVMGKDMSYNSEIYFVCNNGYDLYGKDTLKCLSDGTWDNTIPRCMIISCPKVVIPEFGKINTTSIVYGTTVEYRCIKGYNLVGGKNRYCLDYGEWDIPASYCEIKSCALPVPSIINGRILTTSHNYTFNSSMEFGCDKGYEMIGNNILTCSESGSWESAVPQCIKINCPQPGGLEHGGVTGTGESIQYMCNEGYIMNGAVERRCSDTGQWDVAAPYCYAVSCSDPLPISHGTILGDNFTFGYQIEYLCDNGFTILGNEERECGADREWDGDVPHCEIISCGIPPDFQNGEILGNNYTYGHDISFICHEGYNLVGDVYRTCLQNGTWSSIQPNCERVTCEMTGIENGFIRNPPSIFYAGNSITYECNRDYRLIGSRYVDCGNDGLSAPADSSSCAPITCPAPTILGNGVVIGTDFTVGQTVRFNCNPFFVLEGEQKLECLGDGNWNGHQPVCRDDFCLTPNPINNGYYMTLGELRFKRNSSLIFKCNVGHKISGSADLQCRYDGSWFDNPPACIPVDCRVPNPVQHAQILGRNYTFGARVVFTCLPGYKLHGENMLQCGSDGVWNGDYPTCSDLCGNPPDIPHSTSQVNTLLTGKTAKYSCHYGYILNGDPNVNCGDSGQWNLGINLSCEPIYCYIPPDVRFGRVFIINRRVGSFASYTCDVGYTLMGSKQLECADTGLWEGNVPHCEPVNCGEPPKTQRYVGDDFTFGREVRYHCEEGFSVLGESILICQANGHWSGNEPTCVRNSCGRLPLPQNSGILRGNPITGIFYNDTVEFICDKNHVMVGVAVVRCLSDSRWNTSPPLCEPVLDIVDFCDADINVQNSDLMRLGFLRGDSATVSCKRGHYAEGNMETVCLQDKSWALPVGQCKRIYCGRPRVTDMMNVAILGLSYFYNDRVRYMCRPGLNPTRVPPVITCTETGSWDGEAACSAICKLECKNGGMCLGMNRCKCRPGYGGSQCEKPICILPCLNGGVCVEPYRCGCPEGYGGSRCHRALCSTLCENGGRCIRPNKCQCYHGFQLPFCKTKLIRRNRRRR